MLLLQQSQGSTLNSHTLFIANSTTVARHIIPVFVPVTHPVTKPVPTQLVILVITPACDYPDV